MWQVVVPCSPWPAAECGKSWSPVVLRQSVNVDSNGRVQSASQSVSSGLVFVKFGAARRNPFVTRVHKYAQNKHVNNDSKDTRVKQRQLAVEHGSSHEQSSVQKRIRIYFSLFVCAHIMVMYLLSVSRQVPASFLTGIHGARSKTIKENYHNNGGD